MEEKSILKLEKVRGTSVQKLVSIVRRFICLLLICGRIGIIMSKLYLVNISVVLGKPVNWIIMAVPMIIHLVVQDYNDHQTKKNQDEYASAVAKSDLDSCKYDIRKSCDSSELIPVMK